MLNIEIPQNSCVMTIGVSGSGKSQFCKTMFKPGDILESDHFRDIVAGDYTSQEYNNECFKKLYDVLEFRMSKGIFTVVDATNLKNDYRKTIFDIALKNHMNIYGLIFDVDKDTLMERRKDWVPSYVIERQLKDFEATKKFISKDFKNYTILKNPVYDSETNSYPDITVTMKVPSSMRHINEFGDKEVHYDIIGDVHGCIEELCEALRQLNYITYYNISDITVYDDIDECKVIFVGDLVDRGPSSIAVIELVMRLVEAGTAHCVLGNHDDKFLRAINRNKVQISDILQATLDEYNQLPKERQIKIKEFLESLPYYLVLDEGKLVVSHAGIKEEYIGKESKRIKDFCLYGDVDDTKTEDGYPIRKNWARDYRGDALIVYGHTPNNNIVIENNTINIDTGCSFGGKLTALQYPELTTYSFKAYNTYYIGRKLEDVEDDTLNYIPDIKDYAKDQMVTMFDGTKILLKENDMRAAIQESSHYTVDPRWLVYVPPTMSPCETSTLDDYLEYPTEAFEYYKSNNVYNKVICERKHMGSRAVVIVCKDNSVAKKRFHITNDKEFGVIYTRKGKRFFNGDKAEWETILLERLRDQLNKTNFFKDFDTDYVILDCELMPWSDKARGLISRHYAPVGRVGKDNLHLSTFALKTYAEAHEDNEAVKGLVEKFSHREDNLDKYIESYRNYCWPVNSVDDIKIAPFHVLAYNNTVNMMDNSLHRVDHIKVIDDYIVNDANFISTPNIIVDLEDEESVQEGVNWWLEATKNGYEGMVVKPLQYFAVNRKTNKLIQPAIKCRGREYLRIIYGPEYTDNIQRLKKRSLSSKRNLALMEFQLGIESLHQFVSNGPFHKQYRAALGVLSLEYTPVDPRL